jgi:hypothetical protein
MVEKTNLIITALQQRIGEIVSNYESQIAFLRAEITYLLDEKNQKEKAIEDYSNEIISKISDQE